jgi:hypothetical protein
MAMFDQLWPWINTMEVVQKLPAGHAAPAPFDQLPKRVIGEPGQFRLPEAIQYDATQLLLDKRISGRASIIAI